MKRFETRSSRGSCTNEDRSGLSENSGSAQQANLTAASLKYHFRKNWVKDSKFSLLIFSNYLVEEWDLAAKVSSAKVALPKSALFSLQI